MSKSDNWYEVYQRIAELTSEEVAKQLYTEFRGTQVSFPTQMSRPAKRDELVLRDYQKNPDTRALSRRYQISQRRIQQIVQRKL